MSTRPADRWARLQTLFTEALGRAPDERRALLDELEAEDARLAAELRSLLDAHETDGPIDEPPESLIGIVAEELTRGLSEGEQIGPFLVKREIGHGGMGDVYLAERTGADFRQRVALKLIRGGFDSDELRARFLNERRILAELDHPGIARLVDGGMTERGQPWFAMEFVEGTPVVEYCDARGMPVRERLLLFQRICEVVQHAHRNLVVHRDLKPGNILVTPDGAPKLLDFGVAKFLEEGFDQGEGTRTGRWLTPEYASPEQLRGDAVTTVSDVYALGVLLYELLTGHRPYRLSGVPAHRLVSTLETTEPERPSTAVSRPPADPASEGAADAPTPQAVSSARATSPQQLRRMLAGDLDTIVLKAIRREPSRRYGSVDQLAEDIRRHLAGEPVLARPDTLGYRATKFVRRNGVAVASAALLVLTLAAGLAGTIWQASRARAEAAAAQVERDRAEDEATRAARAAAMVIDMFRLSDPSRTRGEDITAGELLEQGAQRVETELEGQPALQAQLLGELGEIYFNLGNLARARELADRALVLRRELYGAEHEAVATSLLQVGVLMEAQGRLDSAEVVLRRAVDVLGASGAEGEGALAEAHHHLGEVHRMSGRYEESEAAYAAALEIRRASGDAAAPELAETLFGLAAARHDRGRFDEAGALFREALDIFREQPGAPHPLAIRALLNVGSVALARARYDESEPLMREALELSRQVYGPDHPSTIEAETGMGTIFFNTGRYRDGEPLLRGTVARAERLLGEDHLNVLIVRQVLAMTLSALGRADESVDLLERNLSLMQPGFPTEVLTHLLLSDVHLENGRLADGRSAALEGLRLARASYGETHPYVVLATLQLADLDRAEGLWTDAERRYGEALEGAAESLPPDHRYAGRARLGLAWVRLESGDLAEADSLFQAVLEEQRRALPAGHPEISEPLLGLGLIRVRRGDRAAAEAHLREALEIRTAVYPAGHPRIRDVEAALREVG